MSGDIIFAIVILFLYGSTLLLSIFLFFKRYTDGIFIERWLSIAGFYTLKSSFKDFKGVYIFKNETKSMYYVGQSVKVISRVSSHLRGYGNGDLYADIKQGDSFKIYLIKFSRLKFKSLNQMEKYYIQKYDSCTNGYNRTKGNN